MPTMNKLFLLLFGVLLLSSGCCDEKPLVSVPNNQRQLLIFIDKSQSTELQSEDNIQRVKQGLRKMLEAIVIKPGDLISIHLIHGETAGMPKDPPMAFNTPVPLDECKGKMSRDAAIDDFETAKRQFRKKVEDNVIEYLKLVPATAVVRETDMLSTLEVISDFFVKAAPGDEKTVMYVSDMVHSQPKPRDYDKLPPKNKSEAEQCAAQDWEWLKTQRDIDERVFEKLNVHVIFPEGKTEYTTNSEMRYYWSTLLKLINPDATVEFL